MPKYYKKQKKDIQHQIDQLLAVYDFLGSKNRKKDLPSVKNAENVKTACKIEDKQGVAYEDKR